MGGYSGGGGEMGDAQTMAAVKSVGPTIHFELFLGGRMASASIHERIATRQILGRLKLRTGRICGNWIGDGGVLEFGWTSDDRDRSVEPREDTS